MSYAREMIDAMPMPAFDAGHLAAAIDAALVCAQACSACATGCLTEDDPVVSCAHSDLNCADICFTTVRVLSRATAADAEVVRTQLAACVAACVACASECERHADRHEHCRLCAEACNRCADACRDLLEAVGV
ncbi:MAG TPA: four-helix bundle copper-binding protein [Egibacteraceae bacterium]|nr:four-helix bundle copper-binding protein [Egibacteraceae bacterium]